MVYPVVVGGAAGGAPAGGAAPAGAIVGDVAGGATGGAPGLAGGGGTAAFEVDAGGPAVVWSIVWVVVVLPCWSLFNTITVQFLQSTVEQLTTYLVLDI